METLHFDFTPPPGTKPPEAPNPWALAGVVASGNLEVMVEAVPAPAADTASFAPPMCRMEIQTAAHGFGDVWRAVCQDFFERHGAELGGLRFSVNDAGATPAVVSLRLEQALREFHPPAPNSDPNSKDWPL